MIEWHKVVDESDLPPFGLKVLVCDCYNGSNTIRQGQLEENYTRVWTPPDYQPHEVRRLNWWFYHEGSVREAIMQDNSEYTRADYWAYINLPEKEGDSD